MKITDIFEGPYMRKQRSLLNRAVLKKQRSIEAVEFDGQAKALTTIAKEYKEAYIKLITNAPSTPKELEAGEPKKKAAKKVAKKAPKKKKAEATAADLM